MTITGGRVASLLRLSVVSSCASAVVVESRGRRNGRRVLRPSRHTVTRSSPVRHAYTYLQSDRLNE
jgi:hypothetical protein